MLQVFEELDDGVPVAEFFSRYKLLRITIWRWRRSLKKSPVNLFPGKGIESKLGSKKIAEMERFIGRLTRENDF